MRARQRGLRDAIYHAFGLEPIETGSQFCSLTSVRQALCAIARFVVDLSRLTRAECREAFRQTTVPRRFSASPDHRALKAAQMITVSGLLEQSGKTSAELNRPVSVLSSPEPGRLAPPVISFCGLYVP